MNTRRTHLIWKIPTQDLANTVANSQTLSEVLRHYGLNGEGSYHDTLKTRLSVDGITYPHIKMGMGHNTGRRFGGREAMSREQAVSRMFTQNSLYPRKQIIPYIKRYNLVPYECECGNQGRWRDKKLSLQIDHINGCPNDHRLENLRWICPNCHSQTPTFAGRANRRKPPRPSQIDPHYRHKPRVNQRKVIRPSRDNLEKMVWEIPSAQIAKRFGVSDRTIGKWCKWYGINKPPRGYWNRRQHGLNHEEALLPKAPHGPPPLTCFTSAQTAEIRTRFVNGESQRSLAKAFAHSRASIQAVLKRPNYGTRWGKDKHFTLTAA